MKSSRLPRSSPEQIREWRRRAAKAQEERARQKYDHKYRRLGSNPQRKAKRRERDFGDKAEWVRTLRCCACNAAPPSDPHHHPTRAAGGTAKDLTPLCRDCHDFYHSQGPETFAETFTVDLLAEARRVEREWSQFNSHQEKP